MNEIDSPIAVDDPEAIAMHAANHPATRHLRGTCAATSGMRILRRSAAAARSTSCGRRPTARTT